MSIPGQAADAVAELAADFLDETDPYLDDLVGKVRAQIAILGPETALCDLGTAVFEAPDGSKLTMLVAAVFRLAKLPP